MSRVAAVIVIACVLASVSPQAQDAERLLKAAINTEMVDGDLKAAIAQYQKVAASGNRPLAAQALVRMAECYQKLGDAEAQKIYERVVRDYADQRESATLARARLTRSGSAASTPTGMVNRRVWTPGGDPSFGTVSADGRVLSYTDWSTGDLFVHDFVSGRNRQVTNKGSFSQSNAFAEESAMSRDGRFVAYSWFGTVGSKSNYELRVAPVDGNGVPESRLLIRNDDIGWLAPADWSPDGSWIAVIVARVDRTAQLALVSAKDGSLRVLKSSRWRGASEIFFSPDGKYLAFDSPTGDAQEPSDVYVLAIDGSRETAAVVSASHEIVMGWSPDGSQLLFASDRGGATGLWAQPMLDGRPQGSAQLIKPNLAPDPLGVSANGTMYLRASASEQDLFIASVDFTTGRVLSPPSSPVERYVGTNRTPAWSRDGKNLSYVSLRRRIGTNQEVFLVIHSLETGQTRELDVPQLNYFQMPQWSRDGQSLIARGGHVNGKGGIHRIDARTGQVQTIVDQPCVFPQESSDGKLYARCLEPKTDQNVFVEHDLSTGSRRELFKASNAGLASLSPDGHTLAVNVNDLSRQIARLMLIPVDGGQPRELTQLNVQKVDSPPVWTPDGRRLVVKKTQSDGKEELWVVPLDGTAHVKLDLTGPFGQFVVHPDGKRFAFVAGERKGEVWVLENFLSAPSVATAVGTRSTTLTTRRVLDQGSPWARISPDGRYLARPDNSTANLQLIELSTGKLRALTDDGNPIDPDHRYPLASTFSRDGTQIAYQWELEKDERTVLRVALTAENARRTVRTLYDNADVSLAPTDWSPDGRWIAAVIRRKDHTAQIGVVGVKDGSLHVLKTVDWSRVGGLRFSPDSTLLAYHRPAAEGRFDRDVFVIAVDGSREFAAAESPGDDVVLEWEPTGQRLLVASDRGGSTSIWSVAGTAGRPLRFDLVKSDVGIISSLGPTKDGTLFYNLLPTESNVYVAQFDAAKGQLSSPPVQPIQQFKGFNSGGQWSNDGKYIVYASRRDVPAPINVTRVVVPFFSVDSQKVERELFPELSYGNIGRLSPGGRTFIVRGADLKGRSGILTVDAKTGDAKLAVSNDVCSGVPYWAPDGKSFFCYREKQIVQVDAASATVLRRFEVDGQGLGVSPDGRYIVHADEGGGGLKLLALATGASHDLIRLSPPSSRLGNQGSVDWTPDSRNVAFYGRVNGDEGMWLAPIDGTAPRKIDVAVGPISSWRFNSTGQVVFSTATGFGNLETWKIENLPVKVTQR